jgi:hypothetical protein
MHGFSSRAQTREMHNNRLKVSSTVKVLSLLHITCHFFRYTYNLVFIIHVLRCFVFNAVSVRNRTNKIN